MLRVLLAAVLLATIACARAPSALRVDTPPIIDGALDEPAWSRARTYTLVPHRADATITLATTVRFLVDNDALYVGFDVDDDDPHSPYTRRDDPLYDSEATELFIDADGDGASYIELQASPHDVHFDARFTGGPRKNMDTSFDVPFATKTRARAGGYTQEWRVPRANVPDATALDTQWRINVFRLERRRHDGKVIATEASALSPPERNDFHAVEKFIWLKL